MKKILLILIFISSACSTKNNRIAEDIATKQERISGLIESGSNDSLKILFNSISDDTIKLQLVFDISYKYYLKNDSLNFRFWNSRSLEFAQKQKDSSKIAESQWDLGNFFYRNEVPDSSYYFYNIAYKNYSNIHDDYFAARMLMNMAVIQEGFEDYSGSEVKLIKALEIFQDQRRNLQLYIAYNTLGVVYNGINDVNNSKKYYLKAIQEAKILKDSAKISNIYNNIGVMWQDNENYLASIESFRNALKYQKLEAKEPKVFSNILDNLAYSYFKLDSTPKVYNSLSKKAFEIRNSISNRSGIIMSNIHFGEYKLAKYDTTKAVEFFEKAVVDSKKTENYDHLLEAYSQLGKLYIPKAPTYFKEYVNLSDSLAREERTLRNKFARIRFETDNYIQENKELNRQRLYILLLGLLISSGLILAYFYRAQLARTKELEFEREQQKSNERIYELLLKQQTKLEEGRQEERTRISAELHDGVLGKLFGTRMSMGLLDMNNEVLNKYLNELQKIETEIREISHDLIESIAEPNERFFNVIKEYLAGIRKSTELDIIVKKDKDLDFEEFNSNEQIHVFRLIQEAIQNVIKHSKATKVLLAMNKEGKSVIIRIKDNGIGFKKEEKKAGIGIMNMKNRISKLHGKFRIISKDSGTEVIFELQNI